MSEISMSCLTIGEIIRLCATQHDCTSCIYKCGMDKLTLDTVSKRTIDSDTIVIPIPINNIFTKVPKDKVCKSAEYECPNCPLCIGVTIGDSRFGSCLYEFFTTLYSEEAEVFASGELMLTSEQIKRFNLEEAVPNGEDNEQD